MDLFYEAVDNDGNNVMHRTNLAMNKKMLEETIKVIPLQIFIDMSHRVRSEAK